MIELISESKPIARKEHVCMACEFAFEAIGYETFTFSELRTLVKARKANYRIQKGQVYVRQNNIYDGEFYTFKAIPEVHQLCIDHNLYEE